MVVTTIAGCIPVAPASVLPSRHGSFVLVAASDAVAGTAADAAAPAMDPGTRGEAPPPLAAADSTPPPMAEVPPRTTGSGGGGSTGGGSVAIVPLGPHLTLANGQVLPLPAGDAVALAAGTSGDVMIDVPGRVPVSIFAPGAALTVHTRAAAVADPPSGLAHVSGTVSPAVAGLVVQFLAPGRSDFVGGVTLADGTFAFDAPVAGDTQGLVLARDPGEAPRLALGRASVSPGAAAAPLTLTLEDPQPANPFRLLGVGDGSPPVYPALPVAYTYDAALLQVLEATPAPAWTATLISTGSMLVPGYMLAGFDQLVLLRAANPDHTQGLTFAGRPGAWPVPMLPPDLTGLAAAPAPGTTLSWPAVAGAGIYVARIYAPDVPEPPLWEGLTTGTHLPLPAGLTGFGAGSTLQVDAWDVPGMSIYAVASTGGPRRFVLPPEPNALGGRHSWSRKGF
ncbi:MAG: hypothetical protein JWM80_26 [Cyanobacteria bacterium RYN_339]|nr:hypothetical protein [Cyanobacteria bacterium RYN_339]